MHQGKLVFSQLMAFAQLTYRESLRDIEVNLRAQANRLYHMGFRCATIFRNTLANANATRPWQIYADFAQHLRIKAFLGTSENAVKTQIWIAVCTFVLIAITKKRLHLEHHILYDILQILSLTMFEQTPVNQLLTPP
jgi:hypothetical protein